MSNPPRVRPLRIDADLHLQIDGRTATLTGTGQRLELTTDTPEAIWAAVTGAALPAGWGRVNGPRGVGRFADRLSGHGLAMTITGPGGPIVHLGEGAASWLGRAITGSSAVQPGTVRSFAPLVWSSARQSWTWRLAALTAGVGIAIIAVARRHWR